MVNFLRKFLLIILVFFVLIGLFSTYSTTRSTIKTVGLDSLVADIEQGKIDKIVVNNNTTVNVTLKDGTKEVVTKEATDSLPTLLKNYGLSPEIIKQLPIEVASESGWAFWLSAILPFLLPLLAFGLLIYFMMRQVQGMNNRALTFGQSGAREYPSQRKDQVNFSSVAGAKEAKSELMEVVEFLKTPDKFRAVGAKIPKGVLLLGAPGTGKTLMARAVAGEAGVPFFHISGSEFVEMFVGVGASRVRDLFRRAKKTAPCIVFIDEIDAVGRQRGAGLGGSHDEREQTLNQILVEMDGFEPNTNVIVVAATNRPDVLDPALLRPGRFDRRVTIDLPDINDREAILKIHATDKPMAKNVSLRSVAERTPGFSGADLANIINEAAILTVRRNKGNIEQQELFESVEKVMLGPERRSHILSEKEKRITAYHEAGHALVAHSLPHSDPVHKVSIISRGQAAGYTLKLPEQDKHFHSRSEFVDDLAVMLGGYATEKEIFGEVTTGAANDLKQATRLARRLVTEYGMSSLGPRTFGEKEEMIFLGREITEQRDYSESVAAIIDKEVNSFLRRAQITAKKIITGKKEQLEKIAEQLLKKETLEREEFEALLSAT
ncbi:cell division protein FtsH [Candidatus Uhrbacteria bacterium RIFCSPLOWO2_12_FULL_46_10]|uniref:ATP-dependent zinc metalloprotease FtsH n=1 Tax=Candidatus Uhrbacteria bacterium RIFCSPLOWO2_01_FULL_47_25 TaxID=1802402 RepID=A0A1F7US14_9BACT|nr:MAG: cell division protein FtsH [Candidatus Uhrbacteria bacterium RIFCSPHIGHO2_01_FULL_46_23]OGL68495.1 MAG: cell division protein FtsH [Candidatus Uhrbacteria bacterium RIFCSPHIGHO2_02_FULL_47_29]OGL75578.1 MAG: cell division protein FtsH [Candidatus Uhrbacteria bacterium RIFCSPHIGHO2_12_FULL_46_13]OGL81093.1 MAG: cell division protein FtsH [Candidatus Uhrbacteria bacterium RIFCSPLOWO2_01_FULL_47_25]OGL86406.1 MAG: cell division protein FtsH [Candidatus Uhrbacteria bacterium RIFCSPLOWO2_02_